MSLDLDLSKDQEVLLTGYAGKKECWNGSTVIILEKLEKEEKLKIKVVKTDVKSLEDDEMTVIGTLAFRTATSVRLTPANLRRLHTPKWSRA